jgi:hypothetical protein
MGLFDSVKDAIVTSPLLNPHIKHRGTLGAVRVLDFWHDLDEAYRMLQNAKLTDPVGVIELRRLIARMRQYEILYNACLGPGIEPTQTIGERLEFAIVRTRPSNDAYVGLDHATLELMLQTHADVGRQLTETYRDFADRRVLLDK